MRLPPVCLWGNKKTNSINLEAFKLCRIRRLVKELGSVQCQKKFGLECVGVDKKESVQSLTLMFPLCYYIIWKQTKERVYLLLIFFKGIKNSVEGCVRDGRRKRQEFILRDKFVSGSDW